MSRHVLILSALLVFWANLYMVAFFVDRWRLRRWRQVRRHRLPPPRRFTDLIPVAAVVTLVIVLAVPLLEWLHNVLSSAPN